MYYADDPSDDEFTAESFHKLFKSVPPLRNAKVTVTLRPADDGGTLLDYSYDISKPANTLCGFGTTQRFDTIEEAIASANDLFRMAGPEEG